MIRIMIPKLSQSIRLLTVILILSCCILRSASADVSFVDIGGSAFADFDGVSDINTSSIGTNSILANVRIDNSFTTTSLNWSWDDASHSLTGGSLLEAGKDVAAKPGGDHVANSELLFTFTIDSTMDLDLSGTWGFDSTSPGGDNLSMTLSQGGTALFTDSTTLLGGVTVDSFSHMTTLSAGTYVFSLNADLTETFNNLGQSSAGWSLSNFKLTDTVAAPEPSCLSLLAFIGLARLVSRRKSQVG